MGDIVEKIAATFAIIDRSDRGEAWITVSDIEQATAAAERVEQRRDAGGHLPLAGITVAVKDNIDVAGLPTTAACPAFMSHPVEDAPAVASLIQAGAVVVGKTNMDQFATGLVGTRSPYGAVRNARIPRYISGGSSSGSAVAVALGQVDLALGTDTAGSGRIPAAFNGIVGLKPTRGLVSIRGTVPACSSLDCISIFAPTATLSRRALEIIAAVDPADPWQRADRTSWGNPPRMVRSVGIPDPDQLDLSQTSRELFAAAVARLETLGARIEVVDISALLEAGQLLYGGALVAERYAAVGEFVAHHRTQIDPSVAETILAAEGIPAHRLASDLAHLARLRLTTTTLFEKVDAIILPSAPFHPLIEEVRADPIALNEQLGRFSFFCNPLDLCAITVPAGQTSEGLPWGITVYAPRFADRALTDLGSAFLDENAPDPDTSRAGPSRPAIGIARRQLVVAGAHLRGQPLNAELIAVGGEFVEQTTTSAVYRLYRLDGTPAKPALVWSGDDGCAIEVEIWSFDDEGFAQLVSHIPPPMAVGPIELVARRWVPGFVCQPAALTHGLDISGHGGWCAYLASVATAATGISAGEPSNADPPWASTTCR